MKFNIIMKLQTINEDFMRKFIKYTKNLCCDDDFVYSYGTKVARIDTKKRVLWKLGYWSVTTSKHINYAAKQLGLRVNQLSSGI